MSASSINCLPPETRTALLKNLSDLEAAALLYDWPFWARQSQLPPDGGWRQWVLLAGRGFGKTRAGAEWVRAQAETGCRHIALVAPTMQDARATMVEGESGLLNICPPWNRPAFEPSRNLLIWPNGARARLFSADQPDRLRGPQFDAAWCDELASWRYEDAWDMLAFALRLGRDPRAVITTTPRPTPLIKRLIRDPVSSLTRGSTFENAAHLAPAFLSQIRDRYEGTRLGRQEMYAELLEDVDGALWTRTMIDGLRATSAPDLARIVVGIDPPVSHSATSDECGLIIAALGEDGRGYVLDDRSAKASPLAWAREAVSAYQDYRADRIVIEVNQGGAMAEAVLRQIDPDVPVRSVRASRGKRARAEPVAALYEQGRISHVGSFAKLEDQMCAFTGEIGAQSPDRVDALVWALTDLMVEKTPEARLRRL